MTSALLLKFLGCHGTNRTPLGKSLADLQDAFRASWAGWGGQLPAQARMPKVCRPFLFQLFILFRILCLTLYVIIELELVGVRAHAHGVHFVLELVVDPELDDVFSENVAFE
jgi:hypothetical protein